MIEKLPIYLTNANFSTKNVHDVLLKLCVLQTITRLGLYINYYRHSNLDVQHIIIFMIMYKHVNLENQRTS